MKRKALTRGLAPYLLREPEEVPVGVLNEELLDPVNGVSSSIPALLRGTEEGDAFHLECFKESIYVVRMELEVDAPPVWVFKFSRRPVPVRLLDHQLRAFTAQVHELVSGALVLYLEPECVDVEGSAPREVGDAYLGN